MRKLCLLLAFILICCALPALADAPGYMPTAGEILVLPADDGLFIGSSAENQRIWLPASGTFFPGDNANVASDFSRGLFTSLSGSEALIYMYADDGNPGGAYYYCSAGEEPVEIATGVQPQRAMISPDGQKVLYEKNGMLYLWQDGNAQYLTEDVFHNFYFGFSASGAPFYTRLTWNADGTQSATSYIWDGAERELLRDGALLAVSSDESVLLYIGIENGESAGVWVNTADGAPSQLSDEIRRFFTNAAQDEFIVISRDQTYASVSINGESAVRIAGERTYPMLPYGTAQAQDRRRGIYTLGVDTLVGTYWYSYTPDDLMRLLRINQDGSVTTLVQGVERNNAYLLEDGRTLLCLKNGAIRRVDAENPGGEPEILVDGGVIGFIPGADGRTLFYCTEDSQMYMRAEDGAVTLIMDDIMLLDHSRLFAGRALLFMGDDGKLYSACDGAVKQVSGLPDGSKIGVVECAPWYALALDYSTAPGEAAYGSTMYVSFDGENFSRVGEW